MSLKNNKSLSVNKIIEEAIDMLSATGIPIFEQTERRRERMAMAFLAVAGVTNSWKHAQVRRKTHPQNQRDHHFY
jgi:hypothetical protein